MFEARRYTPEFNDHVINLVAGFEDPYRHARIHAIIRLPATEPLREKAYNIATHYFVNRHVPYPDHPQMTPTDNAYLKLLLDSADLLSQSRNMGLSKISGKEYYDIPKYPLNVGPLHLDGADFSHRTWLPVFPSTSTFNHAHFDGASLYHYPLTGSFNGAHFDGANLSYAPISGSFNGAHFDGANLSYTNFRGANLDNAASLFGANLYGATGLTDEQRNSYFARGAVLVAPPPPPPPYPPQEHTWVGSGN